MMAHLIMDHGVSGCFGTRLAPKTPSSVLTMRCGGIPEGLRKPLRYPTELLAFACLLLFS